MVIMKLEVKIIEGMYLSKMNDYGQMIDDIKDFHNIFYGGLAYGLIGECGEGGWGLSYNLSGNESYISGEIKINDKLVTLEDLKKVGWYVGETVFNNTLFPRKKSIKQLIIKGLKTSRRNTNLEDIINLFSLTIDRVDSSLNDLSWEKWRASIAIGYAFGKKIYCFPWLNTRFINDLILNTGIHRCIDLLKEDGSIVIIPTQKQESLNYFVDELLLLDNMAI